MSDPMYVIYSPTMDRYMFVATDRDHGIHLYNVLWVKEIGSASHMEDVRVEYLLDMCREVANEGILTNCDGDWCRTVAYGFNDLDVNRVIESITELIVAPVFDFFGVDFTKAEVLFKEGMYHE